MTEYKTIECWDLNKFNDKCDELAKKGFMPYLALVVVAVPSEDGGGELGYIQQWSKYTPDEKQAS